MRRLLTAGAAVVLALTGLIAAPATGSTISSTCDNGYPSYVTEQTLVNTVVYVGTQRQVSTSPSTLSLAVCFSDTELAQPSNLTGGYVKLTVTNNAPGTWEIRLECRGDSPTMLASVNCDATSSTTTTTTTSTSPLSAGASISGWTLVGGSTVTLGTTGANTGSITTTTTNPSVTYGGTCATVAGITPPTGTRCSSDAVNIQVARGDVTPTASAPVCVVAVLGTCVVEAPTDGIVLFGDTTNPTQVTVLGTTVFSDPGPKCVGPC